MTVNLAAFEYYQGRVLMVGKWARADSLITLENQPAIVC
jgi:hypothetical protein